jgi:hypothetical protein
MIESQEAAITVAVSEEALSSAREAEMKIGCERK